MPQEAPYSPFDPLAVENIGVTLAVELLERPLYAFPPEEKFPGAGVYALYYEGPHPAYKQLLELDNGRIKYPVYIGQAVREKASQGFSARPTSKAQLFNRIRKHARSVEQVENLDVVDFKCRFLVLNDAYIGLAESVMIMAFRPPWNGMGLGSNPVGGPRMRGLPSLWDSLHPGRAGRPGGSEEQAKKAAAWIEECIDRLGEVADDPRARRMYEKIMRFV
jgi:hypothetical protein